MAKDRDERTLQTGTDDIEIFGAHKTREQIKAEEKARKQAEREALRRELEARRAAAKTKDESIRRFDLWSVVIVLAAIVLLGAAALVLQFSRAAKMEAFERDESRTTYFYAEDATPELADDGVTAAVSEVYFTNGGYLAVHLVLGNGTANAMALEALEVTLINGEDQQIAGGYAKVPNSITIPVGGTETYTFYISPEHITLNDDPLTTLGYTVNVTAAPITESMRTVPYVRTKKYYLYRGDRVRRESGHPPRHQFNH